MATLSAAMLTGRVVPAAALGAYTVVLLYDLCTFARVALEATRLAGMSTGAMAPTG
jgi:hypothetical protein